MRLPTLSATTLVWLWYAGVCCTGLVSAFTPPAALINSPPLRLSQALLPTVSDVMPFKTLSTHDRPSLLDTVAPVIAVYEDRRRWAYTDPAGNRSVGIGSNLDVHDAPAKLKAVGANYRRVRAGTDPLTEHQIDALFHIDLASAVAEAKRITPHFDQHPLAVQAVVIDLCFNLGTSGFMGLKSFRRHLDQRDYVAAGRSLCYTHWYKQVGWRAQEDVRALTKASLIE